MPEDTPPRLTEQNALDKAQECRGLAREVGNFERRAALLKMAEAWEELARSVVNRKYQFGRASRTTRC